MHFSVATVVDTNSDLDGVVVRITGVAISFGEAPGTVVIIERVDGKGFIDRHGTEWKNILMTESCLEYHESSLRHNTTQ